MTATNKIDVLNILLLFVSLFLALLLPFELFLFSYAVLGPLHYLTEINWLHKKNYFVKDKKYIWILLAFTVGITFVSLFRYLKLDSTLSYYLNYYSRVLLNVLIISSLLFSIGLVFFKDCKKIILALILAVLVGVLFLKFIPFSFVIVGVFLPTLIHVYLFTMFFMALGTMKNRSVYGVVAIAILALVPLFIFYNPFLSSYEVSQSVKNTFLETRFKNVIVSINQILNESTFLDFDFNSVIIIKIQTFIAFAYTYHYLNWFSKTSLIGWNKNLSRNYIALIFALWFASIALYLYSYRVGVLALFFLSMFHVIVEFPLNIISIKEVFFKRKSFD